MLLVVGQIGKPHGIRGEVSVTVRTDEPEERFTAGSVFITEVPRDRRVSTGPAAASGVRFEIPKRLVLEQIRWHQGRGIAVFENIYDRNLAEELRGVFLQVDSDDLKAPEDPEEFRDHELIGLRVESVDGVELGSVARIDHAAASDLLVLDKTGGGVAFIPFVSQLVPTVDVAGGKIIVDLPEGLLDL
ncbi:ribosome maturation factor RimM [Actinoplanes sp. TBRC 11911]|nr:ribosome maturation factor RimM [Actinoplanes sp. TBRC 11911]